MSFLPPFLACFSMVYVVIMLMGPGRSLYAHRFFDVNKMLISVLYMRYIYLVC